MSGSPIHLSSVMLTYKYTDLESIQRALLLIPLPAQVPLSQALLNNGEPKLMRGPWRTVEPK